MKMAKTHSTSFASLGIFGADISYLSPYGELTSFKAHDEHALTVVCHAPWTFSKLKTKPFPTLDLLELFTFLRPAQFCAPTITGLARALDVDLPQNAQDAALCLQSATHLLLDDLKATFPADREAILNLARIMGQNGKGWGWTPVIFAALAEHYDVSATIDSAALLKSIRALPEYAETAPPDTPQHHLVTGDESRARLAQILSHAGKGEIREAQKNYATQLTAAFAPRELADYPFLVLAEAGTGVGKTYGYLAPASVWAEKNQGTVWVSTYTKNLQRQIAQDIQNLYPDPATRDQMVVTRKGRENYMCLLNYADMAAGAPLSRDPRVVIAAGILARWITATKDGDIQGGDFPVWLASLLGVQNTLSLTDRRGECLYAACDYYHRCFIERSVRKARHARIVIANHALVMTHTARASTDDPLPTRYVFDESHHLFDAADGVFSAHLTAQTGQELRRWILGYEGTRKSRARGLKKRLEGLIDPENDMARHLDAILEYGRCLPADGALERIAKKEPRTSCEQFLAALANQIAARTQANDVHYGAETDPFPVTDIVLQTLEKLISDLYKLHKPLKDLASGLWDYINDNAEHLNTDTRRRMDGIASGLEYRGAQTVSAWISMLEDLKSGVLTPETIAWFGIDRIDGKIDDIGYYRHLVDPMKAFATILQPQAHGIIMTSATLKDTTDNEQANWRVARVRTGADALTPTPLEISVPSPFDYASLSKIIIIKDVSRDKIESIAAAYRALLCASAGGGLGIFTAIQRLKAVHSLLLPDMDKAQIPLYAQHVDPLDTATLVDMFRTERNACLLGTDAVRDGVDVPGDSLRLIVFDRVPWPRASVLHRGRKIAFGKSEYDDRLVRLKLKQAYGRLIRRANDKGVFVLLDSAIPSRLLDSFPVQPEKLGLADAVQSITEFLK